MALQTGTTLVNRYKIEKLLARGGMGSVYQAIDLQFHRFVAIKESFLQTTEIMRQFKREATILARLQHPSLPLMIDHFTLDNRQFLVMEFVGGQDLWQLTAKSHQPLSEIEAVNYIIQVCEAVIYMHGQTPPIIHRDIKPHNIKITKQNRVVLVDFGIAKIIEGDKKTFAGARGVTPGYSPPEQYTGQGTTTLSDLYALGATLYACITHKKPPDSARLILNRGQLTPPHELSSKISQKVSEAIMQAMQPDPNDRPISVKAWQEILLSQTEVEWGATTQQISNSTTARCWLIDQDGTRYPLNPGDQLRIGRGQECNIQLQDRKVSRYHALLKFDGHNCTVYDQHSANGTYINQKAISANGHSLKPGDKLQIGHSYFIITISNINNAHLKRTRLPTQPSH